MLRKFNLSSFSYYFLFSSLILFPGNLYCQNYTLKTYTTTDGLPHNNIRSVVRDSSGFLWLGTWGGLSRFDGYTFRNYYHEPDDSTSIPFFSIHKLLVDQSNNLWIITDDQQLSQYNRTTDNFRTIKSIGGINTSQVTDFRMDEGGNLWFLTRSSIIMKRSGTENCEISNLNGSDGKPYFNDYAMRYISLCRYPDEVWIAGSEVWQFRKYKDDNYSLEKVYPVIRTTKTDPIYFDFTEWYDFYISPDGDKWLFSNTGLFRFEETRGEFVEFRDVAPADDFSGRRLFIWGWRDEGVYIYDATTKKLSCISGKDSKWTSAILPDGEDLLWLSNITRLGVAQGFSRISWIPDLFRNTLLASPDSASPAVYSVIMDKDNKIWTGVRGLDHIVQFGTDNEIVKKNILTPRVKASTGYIRSLVPVKEGIWIGYYQKLLQFYDYKSGSFRTLINDEITFRAIAINHDGKIYIGTNDLTLYDPVSGKREVLWQSPDRTETLFKISVDNDGTVWGGLPGSQLLKYDPRSGTADIIKVFQGMSNIEDIIRGDNGDLWLALLGKGVCRYNTENGSLKYYTTSKGLSNNTTYCLLRDKSGNIWVSTNEGISLINPETDQIRVFDETDGVKIKEFNSGAKFINDKGEFFFGGMGGFVRFYPDSILPTYVKPGRNKILLTQLTVSGENRLPGGGLDNADTIILDRGEDNFYLSFSSSDFVSTGKILFRHKITGVDKKWITTDSQNRSINYSNLRPGWYNLVIEATDHDGNWSISRAVTLRIRPGLYQTKIFRIFMPSMLLAITIFSIIVYLRQVRQRERSKQDELKLQSLQSQMNPHFIFNSLNSINYFISKNDRLSANRYISDFSRLIRSILSNMGSIYIPFEHEIDSLSDYLRIEHLRFGDKFDYRIDVSEVLNLSEIEVCPGIIQPLIENAIWHGVRALEERKGMITIKYTPFENERLRCIVEDDGVGRRFNSLKEKTNNNHKPKGISIILERLQITGKLRRTNFGFEISDLNPGRPESGTRVIVEIPARTVKSRQI